MKTSSRQSADADQLTILSRETVIRGGSFDVAHDVTIRGVLEGQVNVGGRLDVLTDAEVDGSVHAREAVIAGTVRGDLIVEGMLVLRASAVVGGKISAGMIAVEDGASGDISVTAGPEASTGSPEERRRHSTRQYGEALERARVAVAAAERGAERAQDAPARRIWTRGDDDQRFVTSGQSTDELLTSPALRQFLAGESDLAGVAQKAEESGLPSEEHES